MRLVETSSREGDLVLDHFVGAGTAAVATEVSKRSWMGIDSTYSAIAAIQELFKRRKLSIWGEIELWAAPETEEDRLGLESGPVPIGY